MVSYTKLKQFGRHFYDFFVIILNMEVGVKKILVSQPNILLNDCSRYLSIYDIYFMILLEIFP